MPVEKCTECSVFFHATTLIDGVCPPCWRARALAYMSTVDLLEVVAQRGMQVRFWPGVPDESEELPIVTVARDGGHYRYWIGDGYEDDDGELVESEAVEDFLQ